MKVRRTILYGTACFALWVCLAWAAGCFPDVVMAEDAPAAAEKAAPEADPPPSLQKIIQGYRELRDRLHARGYARAVKVLDEKIEVTEKLEVILVKQFTLNRRRLQIQLEMKNLEPALEKNDPAAKRKWWDLEEELVNIHLDLAQARKEADSHLEKMNAQSLEEALEKDRAAEKKEPQV